MSQSLWACAFVVAPGVWSGARNNSSRAADRRRRAAVGGGGGKPSLRLGLGTVVRKLEICGVARFALVARDDIIIIEEAVVGVSGNLVLVMDLADPS